MPDPIPNPDPTRPDPTAGWLAHAIYQFRLFFREFGASQLGMLVITALLGYIGIQSYTNADYGKAAVDKATKAAIVAEDTSKKVAESTASTEAVHKELTGLKASMVSPFGKVGSGK